MIDTELLSLSARHSLTIDCISKLVQSMAFYPAHDWSDILGRVQRLRNLINLAYTEAGEIWEAVNDMASEEPEREPETEPTKEVPASAATETSTGTKENILQVNDKPGEKSPSSMAQDEKTEAIRMLKLGIPVKEVAEMVNKSLAWVYKVRSEVM